MNKLRIGTLCRVTGFEGPTDRFNVVGKRVIVCDEPKFAQNAATGETAVVYPVRWYGATPEGQPPVPEDKFIAFREDHLEEIIDD